MGIPRLESRRSIFLLQNGASVNAKLSHCSVHYTKRYLESTRNKKKRGVKSALDSYSMEKLNSAPVSSSSIGK